MRTRLSTRLFQLHLPLVVTLGHDYRRFNRYIEGLVKFKVCGILQLTRINTPKFGENPCTNKVLNGEQFLKILNYAFRRLLCLNTLFVLGRVTNIHDLCKAQSINRHFCRETFRVLNLAEQSDWLIFLRKNGIVQSRMPATQNRGEGINVPWLFQYTNLSSHIIYKPFLQKIIS